MTPHRLLRAVLFALVVASVPPAARASHIKGFDLSHSVAVSGEVTFTYRAFHVNNLKYPASSRPATTDLRYLQFGDAQRQGVAAQVVTGGPANCDTDPDGRCRIEYLECEPPGTDASLCETAVTTRIYRHTYACTDPTDLYHAVITRGTPPTDLECCRQDGFLNVPNSGASSIEPTTTVAPCCLNSLSERNGGPTFSSLPVFNAFQEVRYFHPLGASDPDGDPLALGFRTEVPLGPFACPVGCPTPPTPALLTMTAWDPCQDPAGAVMSLAPVARLDWDRPKAGVACDQTRLGSYGVGVEVVDTCGATATREYRVDVFEEPTTSPPVLTLTPTVPPGLVDICLDLDTVIIDLSASDPDTGDTVTLSMSPTGVPNVTFTQTPGNPATGRFTFSPKTADAQGGSHGFTFIAQDDETPLNTTQESVTIEVIVCNHAPVAVAGGPYTAECSGTPTLVPLDGSASFDPDGDPLTYLWVSNCPGSTWDDPTLERPTLGRRGSPPCPVSCSATLSVRDQFLSDHDTTTIFVLDTVAPVAVGLPPDETLECPASPPPLPVVTAADACSPVVGVVFDEQRIDGNCVDRYQMARTWTMTDDCANVGVATRTVTIDDSMAPVLSGVPADGDVECDAIPAVPAVSASDGCDPDVSATFSETITPRACDQNYILARTWSSTDRCGNVGQATQRLTVTDTTAPLLVGVPPDTTAGCNAIPTWPVVTADDNCDRLATVTTSESTLSGSCAGRYVLVRTWLAVDDCGNEARAEQRITVDDRSAPTLLGVPADATVECDAIPLAATVTAEDDCDANPTVALVESTVPGACDHSYTLVRTWTATDACGNAATAEQRLSVVDTHAPVLVGVPADATVECDAIPLAATVTAEDDCDANPTVALVESTVPGACDHSYTLVRTWTATDACGNAATAEQRLSVVDTHAPVLVGVPADATVECDAIPAAATPSANDNCDGDPAITLVESIVPGACAQSYTLIRTWTATDACGNAATAEQRLSVVDTQAPVFASVPVDATVECDAIPAAAAVTASDTCDANPTVTLVETTEPGRCAHGYVLVRTWTATDDCGNVAMAVQRLTVVDTTAPVLSGVPASATVECDAVPAPPLVSASDNCASGLTPAFSEVRVDGGCADSYELQRTWRVTDDCGNEAVATQILVVIDSVKPVLAGVPADVTVECDAIPPVAVTATASDNCDPAPVVAMVETRVDGACPDSYTLRREWTATDRCGNSSTALQRVEVRDTIAPTARAMLEPLAPATTSSAASTPRPPRPPGAPSSACSAASHGVFQVICAGDDNCDPSPRLRAQLRVTNHDVVAGGCATRVDEIDVLCDEVIELRLLAPPCPARGATSPAPPVLVSGGRKLISGEAVVLRVVASDRCGNEGATEFDPTLAPMPCPLLGPPPDPRCEVPPCGRCASSLSPLPRVSVAASGEGCDRESAATAVWRAATASCTGAADPACSGTCRDPVSSCAASAVLGPHQLRCDKVAMAGCPGGRGVRCEVGGDVDCGCACGL